MKLTLIHTPTNINANFFSGTRNSNIHASGTNWMSLYSGICYDLVNSIFSNVFPSVQYIYSHTRQREIKSIFLWQSNTIHKITSNT